MAKKKLFSDVSVSTFLDTSLCTARNIDFLRTFAVYDIENLHKIDTRSVQCNLLATTFVIVEEFSCSFSHPANFN